LRDRKVEVLRAVRSLAIDEVARRTRRARYTSGYVRSDERESDTRASRAYFAPLVEEVRRWIRAVLGFVNVMLAPPTKT
jgi:hypothetical protein